MIFDDGLAQELFAIRKTVAIGAWGEDNGARSITCGFDALHAKINLLTMCVRISSGSQDKISYLLLLGRPGFKQKDRIYALDLNPTAPHSNPLKRDDPDSGRMFRPGKSHEHGFWDRIDDRQPSKFARPISVHLPGYQAALDYFCDKINIERPPDLPLPPEQGMLL
ncbi:hypothetical protein [Sulfitobacter sp. W074]|uniref:hypothetical protein n=1 Tax=Sulfitobacter sp. W074 TaxID=2867026 RepID=UPI0021A2E553|nr:hypothetical protein [Sulfitobacter sp. W074]UWR36173.1 hypothetical protein K3762_10160 [Sulfitobacter sp. W074]